MTSHELSFYLIVAIMAMAICMAIIPIMMRLAPHIGMLDSPDERKVHKLAIPRTGGIGIVLGMLVPLLLWLDSSHFSESLILGCVILLVFGAWDDARNIRPIYKFLGQLLAALVVVYYGEVYVYHFPFMGLEELPEYLGKPFTVIAIIGMINALNLSDGLDGLAGGEALISLVAIAYLLFSFEGSLALIIAAATIGGIFGFLRFNSHPARIFMGDAGSQTLGFVLAVLVVYLTQNVNAVVSPVIALLLLGLPIIDSMAVFYMRAKRGDSLVVAAKDHLHHRLLALGFYHYESVMIIYSLQVILVATASIIPYESDILLFAVYLFVCVFLFSSIVYVERKNWRIHSLVDKSFPLHANVVKKYEFLEGLPVHLLKLGISLFIVASAIMSSEIPDDFAISSAGLFLAVIVTRWFGKGLYRLVMFITIGYTVYLLSTYPPEWLIDDISSVYAFYIVMTLLSFIAARISVKDQFQITPLDYLVIVLVVVVGLAPGIDNSATSILWMIVQIIVMFYACELVIQNMKNQWNSMAGAAAFSLALIAYRGLA